MISLTVTWNGSLCSYNPIRHLRPHTVPSRALEDPPRALISFSPGLTPTVPASLHFLRQKAQTLHLRIQPLPYFQLLFLLLDSGADLAKAAFVMTVHCISHCWRPLLIVPTPSHAAPGIFLAALSHRLNLSYLFMLLPGYPFRHHLHMTTDLFSTRPHISSARKSVFSLYSKLNKYP